MSEFSLDVDGIKDEVNNSFKEDEEKIENSSIKEQAKSNAIAIFESDLTSPDEKEKILKPIENFGFSDMSKSASKNELISKRFADFKQGGKEANEIGDKLSDLELQIRDLDPSKIDFVNNGVLNNIINPVKRYFNKYQKAEVAISNIMKSLDKSKKVLENDNVTLLSEENNLRDLNFKLMADIELGKKMDESIEEQIQEAELQGVDSTKIDFVKEEILFPLRQRLMDLQQMVVINQQGIVSLNVIRRNNKELIRGVNRAKNVTISALRTGVMVASALYNQKIVMDKINILNSATEDIIESTSHMLRDQGSDIQKASSEAVISPEKLKDAFNEALLAIEDINAYKQEALPKLKETIILFDDMSQEGQKVVEKIETENILLN